MLSQKLIKSITLTMAAVFIFAVPAFATNMVANPGFENGLNAWTIAGTGMATQGNTVYAGTLSAESTIPNVATQGYFGVLAQTFSASPGVTYYASAWAKSNISPLSSAKAGIQIVFLDSGGTPLGFYESTIGGMTNWREVYVEQVAPAGTAQVKVQVYTFAMAGDTFATGGTAYFDEVVLDTTPITPPVIPFALYNGNFENGLHDWWQNGINWEVETIQPYSGSYSAKNTIGVLPGGVDYFVDLAQDRAITPGQPVYATLVAKTDINSSSSAQAGLIIDFLDATHTPIPNTEVQDTIGGTTSWTQLYVTATAPTGAAYVRYRSFVFANQNDTLAIGGLVYFDEGVLSDQYISPPGNTQLNNPGFENGLNSWNILEPYVVAGTPATWDLESAAPYAGSYSAKNTINITNLDPAATEYYATASQAVVATANTTYYATLEAQTVINAASSAQVGLLIEFIDPNGNVLSSSSDVIGGNTSWTQLYVAATAPTGTTGIRYNCMVFALASDTLADGGIATFDEAVLTTTYIAPPGGSQLQNPGFENGLNAWNILEPYLVSGTPATWGLDQANPFAGIYSAENVININDLDPAASEYYATVSQTLTAIPNTTYYATLQAKTIINPVSTAQAGLLVEFLDSSGTVLASSDDTIGGNTSWTQLYVAATAPAGTAEVRYSCMVSALANDTLAHGGVATFDEAILSTNYIPPPSGSQLVNPGFENGLNGWDILEPYLVVGSPATWDLETAAPFAGNYSAKNVININDLDPAASEYYATVSQTLNATVGTTYYATLEAQTIIDPTSFAQAGLLVEFLDSSGSVLSSSNDTIGGNTSWTQLYVAATAPAGTAEVRYSCMVSALASDTAAQGGIVTFDETVFTTTYIAPPGGSQLQNPGFENGLNGWNILEPYLVTGSPATWDLEQVAPFAGAYSAKNTINITNLDPAATEYYATVNQEINTTVGTTYYATLQASTDIDPVSNAQAGLLIEFLDSSGSVLASYDDTIGGTTNWTQLYLAVTAPTGTAEIRYSCMVTALKTDTAAHGGIVMFDEAVLTTNYIPPPSGGQLSNPGFENGLNGWEIYEPASSPVTWGLETANPFAGTYSAKNTIDVTNCIGFDYYANLSQEFDTTVGTTYYATIEAQTDINPISMAKAGLLIEFLDINGNVLPAASGQDVIGGNTPWRLLYVAATAPTGAYKVRYVAFVSTQEGDTLANNGVVLFDQAVLSTTYIAPPTPSTSLINPDIENGLHDWYIIEPNINWGTQNPTSSWIAQTSQVNGGLLAAKNTIDSVDLNSGFDYYADLSQTVPAVPGDPVYATVQVKTNFDFNSSAKAGLELQALNSAGGLITALDDDIVGTNGWTQLQVSFVAPAGTAEIRYRVYVFANENDTLANGGIAYFDDAFLAFTYINHLGMVNGQDIFPQETEQLPYYSGAASTRATIRYLLGNSPTQSTLYNTYHWSGAGNDMLSGEIMTALNSEVGQPYNFTDWYQTTNQSDAIQNIAYWVDYLPPMGIFSPAAVPVNGGLNWRLVRGIVTDVKPHPIGVPMPNFSVEGMWVNDAASPGLGFNIYQTTTAFQADYLPLSSTGTYRSVYEPPEHLNQKAYKKELESTFCTLVQAKPNASLARQLAKISELNQTKNAEAGPMSVELSKEFNSLTDGLSPQGGYQQAPPPVFSLIYLAQALPGPLMNDPEFASLFDKAQSMRQFNVVNLDNNKEYAILALDRMVSNSAQMQNLQKGIDSGSKSSQSIKVGVSYMSLPNSVLKTHILVEAKPSNGACLQSTWDKNGEVYPRVSEDEAVAMAQNYLSKNSSSTKYGSNQSSQQTSNVSLVWSRTFGTPRFHPSYAVSFEKGATVYVHPDGKITSKTVPFAIEFEEELENNSMTK